VLEYSGLRASECLYIDDIKAYCEAALSLGFGGIIYDFRSQNLSRELERVL
jgi:FMN phosphatase YigB (HAD superfamily)